VFSELLSDLSVVVDEMTMMPFSARAKKQFLANKISFEFYSKK